MESVLFNFLMNSGTKDLLDQIARSKRVSKSSILNDIVYEYVVDEIKKVKENEKLLEQYRSSAVMKTKRKPTNDRSRVGNYIENDNGTWVLASDYEAEELY